MLLYIHRKQVTTTRKAKAMARKRIIQPTKVYGVKMFDGIRFTFNAVDQADADSKVSRWNRYHSFSGVAGYDKGMAVEVIESTFNDLHNEWIPAR